MQLKNYFRLATAFAIFFLAHAAEVQAEVIYKIPGDFGWKKSLPLQLIFDKAVAEDLGLSEEVTQKLKSLHEQIQSEVETERLKLPKASPNASERMVRKYDWNEAILHDVRNRYRKELNELITSKQQDRLNQIYLKRQRAPTDTLSDSGVAQELKLTGTQRAEIYKIHWEYVKAEMDEIKGRRVGPDSSALKEDAPEKVMGVTDEQRQAFELLRGKPLGATDVK